MNRTLFAVVAAAVLLSSCVSQPEPASSSGQTAESDQSDDTNQAYKDRAVALVQGTPSAGGTSSGTTESGDTDESDPAAVSGDSATDVPPPAPGVLTPEEEAFLSNYLARLQYMVYYDTETGLDPQTAKVAVSQANAYLIQKLGLNVVDFDQIERNKKDQLAAYQAETGGSIDLIQYIAQKNNADVYVEIAFTVATSAKETRHYATVQGAMKFYDTSTAQLLGTISYQSPQGMSPYSSQDAVNNTVMQSVSAIMPRLIDQSKSLIKGALSRGIRYEVVIQNTPDSRAVSSLRRALAKSVREVEQASYSAAETRLYLYTFKTSDKVEDAIYDAADRAGMPDIYLVFSRGKAFTFNSGL
ncbi:MAG TPA: DUF6175 family protein [Spirochaetales bacterium]|nr:hypothetical protein [Spirochaetia bacterium]HPE36921.1 DUF6175 family protein [Spirochaetales bacterium]